MKPIHVSIVLPMFNESTPGFAPLTILNTRQVWLNCFRITRAVATLITALLPGAVVARSRDEGTALGHRR